MIKRARSFFVFLILWGLGIQICLAQSQNGKPQGMFPEASFYAEFNKHFERDIFRAFYSWEGRMGTDVGVFRKGKQAAFFKNEFLTVGGETTDNRINIVGTSYILEGRYQFSFTKCFHLAGGMAHNSSHLTQDLTDLVWRETMLGKKVPKIEIEDLNVIFGELKLDSPWRYSPKIKIRIQPINLRGLQGGSSRYDLPAYLSIEETLWQGKQKRVVVTAQHEFGKETLNDFSAGLELFAKNQEEGRLQLFAGWAPGSGLRMSTNKAWHKDGFRIGLRIVFDAH